MYINLILYNISCRYKPFQKNVINKCNHNSIKTNDCNYSNSLFIKYFIDS